LLISDLFKFSRILGGGGIEVDAMRAIGAVGLSRDDVAFGGGQTGPFPGI
jgi:hypothetical protein